jgi:hypothetical protein
MRLIGRERFAAKWSSLKLCMESIKAKYGRFRRRSPYPAAVDKAVAVGETNEA